MSQIPYVFINEKMFKTIDESTPNVICNGTSCAIFSAGNVPYRAKIPPGMYFFEVWGASGGDQKGPPNYGSSAKGGRGGYTSGYALHTKKEIYLFIGTQGSTGSDYNKGGWNGGGSSTFISYQNGHLYGGAGGGGATDIALILGDEWRESRTLKSLKSRVIVAAGGGGAWGSTHIELHNTFISDGGVGGGQTGGGAGFGYTRACNEGGCSKSLTTAHIHYSLYVTGATQTTSGSNSGDFTHTGQLGSFGIGGDSNLSSSTISANTGGGGGGGWFGGVGGAGGINHYGTGGSGGSSFAHTVSNTNSNSSLGNQYLVFNEKLLSGDSNEIPNPYEGIKETSTFNFTNGAVRITFISPIDPRICSFYRKVSSLTFLNTLISSGLLFTYSE